MLTRKAVNKLVNDFLTELKKLGYQPTKAILFGSYANGIPHQYSDIDLAVWEKSFCGVNFIDFEPFVRIVSKYHPLQLHTFPDGETSNENPFIEEIEASGLSFQV